MRCNGTRIRAGRTTFGALALIAVFANAARSQEPDTAARVVPAANLIAYVEWDGLDAHDDAWKQTAAFRVLSETTTGAMLESLAKQLGDILAAGGGARNIPFSKVASLADHVLHHGATLAVSGKPGQDAGPVVTLVFPGAGQGPSLPLFEEAFRGAARPGAAGPARGRTIAPLAGNLQRLYFSEGDDLIVVLAEQVERVQQGVEAVAGVIERDEPSVLDHPIRTALRNTEGGFEPAALGFVDVQALPLPPQAQQLGLAGLQRVDYRWGFEGEALKSVARLVAPSPRGGVLAALDQPTFALDSLPPLPSDLRSVMVLSIDWEKVLDAAAAAPQVGQSLPGIEQEFRRQTGLRLREDVLRSFGPKWAFYTQPQTVTLPTNPWLGMAQYLFHPPKVRALVQVRDGALFGKAVDALMRGANRELARSIRQGPSPEFVSIEGGHALSMPPEVAPLPQGVRPALVIGDDYAALGISPEDARAALEADGLDLRGELGDIPENLVALSLTDPRETAPELIANLPFLLQLIGKIGEEEPGSSPVLKALTRLRIEPELIPDPEAIRERLFPSWIAATVDDQGLSLISRESIPGLNPLSSGPVAIALLLPAVQSAREAARRSQCVNNLKQIALAMHNYEAAYGHFPPAAITDSDGNPLLSWRVAILPFLEQHALYNQFHLDEPWDSEHNRKLAEKVVAVYGCPSSRHEPGLTPYRVFAGNGAAFDMTKSSGLRDIRDGTSNTLLVVEAKEAVPWTKPESLEFDPEQNPLDLIGSDHPGGFNVAFADGAVRFLKDTINVMVLKALITKSGGEVVSGDAY